MQRKIIKYLQRGKSYNKGAALLLSTVLLSILILVIGVSVTTISSSDLFSARESHNGSRALLYAEVGAREAMVRLTRNKAYSCNTSGFPDGCFSIPLDTNGCTTNKDCVRVVVGTGTGSTFNPKIITAQGHKGGSIRTIQVSIEYDSLLNGRFATTTWQELVN